VLQLKLFAKTSLDRALQCECSALTLLAAIPFRQGSTQVSELNGLNGEKPR